MGLEQVGLEYVSKYYEQFMGRTKAAQAMVKELGDQLLNYAKNSRITLDALSGGPLSIQPLTNIGSMLGSIGTFLSTASGPVGILLSLLPQLINIFQTATQSAQQFFSALTGMAKLPFKAIGQLIFDFKNFNGVLEEWFGYANQMVDAIDNVALSLTSWIPIIGDLQRASVDMRNKLIRSFQEPFIKLEQFVIKAVKSTLSWLGNLASGVINAVNPFKWLLNTLDRIFYISAGVLVANFVRTVSRGLRDIAQDAIDAASDFQMLKIRMSGLFARDIITGFDEAGRSAKSFSSALAMVGKDVRDVFDWVINLAVTTPFTVETLTNAFTLAKAYGLTTTKAQELLVATGNMVAGMGLGDEVIRRVIENLGQMIQQGKITGTELRDLARGAFTPLLEIFTLMGDELGYTSEQMRSFAKDNSVSIFKQLAKSMGMTTEEIQHMADTTGIAVGTFIDAFVAVMQRDFPDAMKRTARTFTTVISNVKDFIQAVIGFKVLGPLMDKISGKVADVLNALLGNKRFQALADVVGNILARMAEFFLPTGDFQTAVDGFVDWLVTKVGDFNRAFRKLTEQGGTWQEFLTDIGVPDWVVNSVDNLKKAWENFKTWWAENKDSIIGSFNELLEILGLEGLPTTATEGIEGVTGAILSFSQWMIDHGDEINEKIQNIVDTIDHLVNDTWPTLAGQKRIDEIIEPNKLDMIAQLFSDIRMAVQPLTEQVGLLFLNFFKLASLLLPGGGEEGLVAGIEGVHDKLLLLKLLVIDPLRNAMALLNIQLWITYNTLAKIRDILSQLPSWALGLTGGLSFGSGGGNSGNGGFQPPQPSVGGNEKESATGNPKTMSNVVTPNAFGSQVSYNVTVNANYATAQTPVNIAHDLIAVLARVAT